MRATRTHPASAFAPEGEQVWGKIDSLNYQINELTALKTKFEDDAAVLERRFGKIGDKKAPDRENQLENPPMKIRDCDDLFRTPRAKLQQVSNNVSLLEQRFAEAQARLVANSEAFGDEAARPLEDSEVLDIGFFERGKDAKSELATDPASTASLNKIGYIGSPGNLVDLKIKGTICTVLSGLASRGFQVYVGTPNEALRSVAPVKVQDMHKAGLAMFDAVIVLPGGPAARDEAQRFSGKTKLFIFINSASEHGRPEWFNALSIEETFDLNDMQTDVVVETIFKALEPSATFGNSTQVTREIAELPMAEADNAADDEATAARDPATCTTKSVPMLPSMEAAPSIREPPRASSSTVQRCSQLLAEHLRTRAFQKALSGEYPYDQATMLKRSQTAPALRSQACESEDLGAPVAALDADEIAETIEDIRAAREKLSDQFTRLNLRVGDLEKRPPKELLPDVDKLCKYLDDLTMQRVSLAEQAERLHLLVDRIDDTADLAGPSTRALGSGRRRARDLVPPLDLEAAAVHSARIDDLQEQLRTLSASLPEREAKRKPGSLEATGLRVREVFEEAARDSTLLDTVGQYRDVTGWNGDIDISQQVRRIGEQVERLEVGSDARQRRAADAERTIASLEEQNRELTEQVHRLQLEAARGREGQIPSEEALGGLTRMVETLESRMMLLDGIRDTADQSSDAARISVLQVEQKILESEQRLSNLEAKSGMGRSLAIAPLVDCGVMASKGVEELHRKATQLEQRMDSLEGQKKQEFQAALEAKQQWEAYASGLEAELLELRMQCSSHADNAAMLSAQVQDVEESHQAKAVELRRLEAAVSALKVKLQEAETTAIQSTQKSELYQLEVQRVQVENSTLLEQVESMAREVAQQRELHESQLQRLELENEEKLRQLVENQPRRRDLELEASYPGVLDAARKGNDLEIEALRAEVQDLRARSEASWFQMQVVTNEAKADRQELETARLCIGNLHDEVAKMRRQCEIYSAEASQVPTLQQRVEEAESNARAAELKLKQVEYRRERVKEEVVADRGDLPKSSLRMLSAPDDEDPRETKPIHAGDVLLAELENQNAQLREKVSGTWRKVKEHASKIEEERSIFWKEMENLRKGRSTTPTGTRGLDRTSPLALVGSPPFRSVMSPSASPIQSSVLAYGSDRSLHSATPMTGGVAADPLSASMRSRPPPVPWA